MADERILIIEDEEPIRELIKMALQSAGYSNVYTAGDGREGLQLAKTKQPELILLDLMLPGMDGLDVCRNLRQSEETRNTPIIMLTAKSDEADIVIGLELGANDYITKPFSRKVLIARIRTQFRLRSFRQESKEIQLDGLQINSEFHTAKLHGEDLGLTPSEFEILKLFASHPGRVYSRNQIISHIRGGDYPVTERAMDVQIVNLRRKLGDWGTRIETVRGIGYRLKSEE